MGFRFRIRLVERFRIGPFRVRLSEPVGRGRAWQSVSVGRGLFSLRESGPVGGNHRRRGGRRRGRR